MVLLADVDLQHALDEGEGFESMFHCPIGHVRGTSLFVPS